MSAPKPIKMDWVRQFSIILTPRTHFKLSEAIATEVAQMNWHILGHLVPSEAAAKWAEEREWVQSDPSGGLP